MKILSWNVAGRRNVGSQADFIGRFEPDIVTLQEIRPNTADRWCNALRSSGYDDVFHSIGPVQPERFRQYGVLIASKYPASASEILSSRLPWPEKALTLDVSSPTPFEIHTLHVPPGSSHGWIKIDVLEGVHAAFSNASSRKPRVLTGDFNTPREELASGQVITWGERKRANGEYAVRRGRRRWDAGERNVLVGLSEFGMADVFRTLKGYSVEEFSWFSNHRGIRTGRRFDHIFADAALKPSDVRYLHDARTSGLSDHSPLLATFDTNS